MDLTAIEEKLAAGEELKVKYRYPRQPREGESGLEHGVRSDKLLDVSPERRRFYTLFCGETPIWLEEDEIIEITPDDGVYEEFATD